MSKIKMKMVTDSVTLRQKIEEFIICKEADGVCAKSIATAKGKLSACFKSTSLDIDINDVDWNMVIKSVRDMSCSEVSKNSYLAGLRTFMNWLDMGLKTPKIKHIETMKETYTDDELKRLLKKPDITCSYTEYRTYAIELLVCDTGMRASSIRNIKIKDIDFKNRTVYLRHTKTGRFQLLPFSSTTQKALQRLQDAHRATECYSDDIYIFSDVYGSKMSENALRLSIARYNKKHGVEKTSIHAFRHTFAKRWLTECGGNVITLKNMLGHSRVEMSEHYAKLFDTDLQQLYVSPVELLSKKRIKL